MENVTAANLDVVMFLGERGLAFRGDSEKIGDTHNGNFLGILELLARYDPFLQEHIGKTLEKYGIPILDCRGQGYGNAANMPGRYNGAQQHVKSVNPLYLYSPCACHLLNLCGTNSTVCCPEAVTFFGMVQTIYNLFSGSPQRWDILLSHVGSSLHGLSCTRWTDRGASVRLFAAHLPGIKKALEDLL
eukprot:gene983-10755_t